MKTILALLLVTLFQTNSFSQADTVVSTTKRKPEIAFSLSLQNFALGDAKSSTSFLLSPRIGFFVYEGLQIEPEAIMLISTGDPAYMVSGNLVYNFLSASKSIPFLLIGYGIANSIAVFDVPALRANTTIGVLNLGVGVKSFIAQNVALRAEYRYQKFSAEGKNETYSGYSYSQKIDARLHGFEFGIVVVP